MRLSIAEIVKSTVEAKTKEEKVAVLQKNNSLQLRMILRYTYDPEIKFLVPDTRPPWKKNGLVNIEGRLYQEARNFRIILKDGPYDGKLPKVKVETIFINILESIDDKDAEIVVNMIEKKPIKGISREVIEEAYPGIFEEKFI